MRRRFPLVTTLAPIAASAVLFALTRSAYTLVFAMLGPIIAIGATVDGALHRRGQTRRDEARYAADIAEAEGLIESAHAEELAELVNAVAPAPGSTVIRLGTGQRPSGLRVEPMTGGGPRVVELRARAAILERAPIEFDAADGVGIVGQRLPALALARAVILRLAVQLPWGETRIVAPPGPDWDWAERLPQPVRREDAARSGARGCVTFELPRRSVTIELVAHRSELTAGPAVVIEVTRDGRAAAAGRVFAPDLVGVESAWSKAADLSARVGAGAGRVALPPVVEFADLAQDAAAVGLSALAGSTGEHPIALDLVDDGPHAIVGGTTGSGKSELLVSWVLGMASERSPALVSFLFVDFKGGAAFDPLLALPHAVGVITDLDAEQSLRALTSLGAELRRRERELARHGLRSIDDRASSPPFPRLVVVVDEYAALVETHTGLHAVFADIAARGRSLGVHLILCTQRPAGVVRDGILANCALRISLRVMVAADSTAVLGTDAAAALPARPLGRALVSFAGAPPREFQVARSALDDITRIARRWSSADRPSPPWLPPLAAVIPLASVDGGPDAGIPFGLEDLPEQQAQRPARFRPAEQGSLLVIGGPRAGKSTTLAALAAAQSLTRVDWLPRELPQLWDALRAGTRETPPGGRLLLLDDLDATIAACDESYRAELLDLIAELLRTGGDIRLAISVQRVGGVLQSLAALCGARLLLRMPDRQEHVLAGGGATDFSATAPPGAGHWGGHRVQVADASAIARPESPAAIAAWIDPASAAIAVVSTRPEQFAERLRVAAPDRHVVPLGPRFGAEPTLDVSRGGAPDIPVADPDAWQSQWNLLATLRRSGALMFDGCSLADVRAILRSRELPPPFARGERPLWVAQPDGRLLRARLVE